MEVPTAIPSPRRAKPIDLGSMTVQELTRVLSTLPDKKRVTVGGARVHRSATEFKVRVEGMPTILCISAAQAAQQAIGANQVQTPGIAGSLSSVDEGKVRLQKERLSLLSDQELDRLSERFVDSTNTSHAHMLAGTALAREMQERKDAQRKKTWEEQRSEQERERKREWQAMLDEQTPVIERLAAVQRGYSDAITGDYSQRDLRFHRRFDAAEWNSAREAISSIGSYNDFDGAAVAEKLDGVRDRLDGIVVGREMSPVIYALLPDDATPDERREVGIAFLEAMGTAKADELSFAYADGGHCWDWTTLTEDADQVRAWWD